MVQNCRQSLGTWRSASECMHVCERENVAVENREGWTQISLTWWAEVRSWYYLSWKWKVKLLKPQLQIRKPRHQQLSGPRSHWPRPHTSLLGNCSKQGVNWDEVLVLVCTTILVIPLCISAKTFCLAPCSVEHCPTSHVGHQGGLFHTYNLNWNTWLQLQLETSLSSLYAEYVCL